VKYVLGLLVFVLLAFAVLFPLRIDWVPSVVTPSPKATIMFGGDMMFDRYIRQVSETVGGDYVFSCIAPTLLEADGVVANLEGPIASFPSVSIGAPEDAPEHFTFTFPLETATLLARHNFLAVNLGNNHIANFGREGVEQTKQYLNEAGVLFFGDPQANEEGRVLHTEVNDIPFSLVNWSDWTSDKTDHTVQQVQKEKELGNVVVVYAHWGDEYVAPPEQVKQLARSFVDAGADIVIGSHPHIVQEIERYKERYIYYSLGNFIFDQYFSEEVRNGLLLSVVFTQEGVQSIKEIPIVLNTDGRTCLVN